MEGIYGVYLGESLCGKVQVQKQGLYYQFFCRCRINNDWICRLRVYFENGGENIGVLTPVDDGFGLCCKLPTKRFPDMPVRFSLIPVSGNRNEKLVSICPEEPFAYIEKLKDAFLARKDREFAVRIP